VSADLLRRAAALMRGRAEAATSGRWFGVTGPGGYPNEVRTGNGPDAGLPILFDSRHLIGSAHYMRGADAHHIASWHPAVALAVADWLEREGSAWQQVIADHPGLAEASEKNIAKSDALAVAKAYLGGDDA